MLQSLKSRLTVASVLWTAGLLLLMHMLSMMLSIFLPSLRGIHSTGAIVAGLILMLAGVLVLRRGVLPLQSLRERLTAVRMLKDERVQGSYPSEVQPLVDDLNALLEDREKAIKRALATAGDLAHGLKTPLALLAQEADRARAEGQHELGDSIGQHVDRMARQVNYHLARARAAASGPASAPLCVLAPCADALVRALRKIYAARTLDIWPDIDAALVARVRREDLDEILGALLDNACKWARSRIVIGATIADAAVVITVDDDGPGLDPNFRTAVLRRGVRMDESAGGHGLGLAIVGDLCEIYGGFVELDSAPMGGLRARVSLPA